MILSRYEAVTVLSPAMATGGPEAAHQLSHALRELGVDSGIGYFNFTTGLLTRAGGRLSFRPPEVNPCLDVYRRYQPVVRDSIPLRPEHLIILPEVLHDRADAFAPASAAVWWLSVDNARQLNPKLRDEAFTRRYFAREDIVHFHQSAYARDYLRSQGVRWSYPLGDYTNPRFTAVTPVAPPRGRGVMHNPAKGGELASAFFDRHADLEPLPITGMSRSQMAERFGANLVFVDFGHFPGKDRMPREAAACGAVVFVRAHGAGRSIEDFPLPDFYKFDETDIVAGELHRRVAAVLAAPERYWDEQAPFRAEVRWEKTVFYDHVRKLLGLPPERGSA